MVEGQKAQGDAGALARVKRHLLEARVDVIVGEIDMRWPITTAVREISWRGTVDGHVPSVDFVRVYLGAPRWSSSRTGAARCTSCCICATAARSRPRG